MKKKKQTNNKIYIWKKTSFQRTSFVEADLRTIEIKKKINRAKNGAPT